MTILFTYLAPYFMPMSESTLKVLKKEPPPTWENLQCYGDSLPDMESPSATGLVYTAGLLTGEEHDLLDHVIQGLWDTKSKKKGVLRFPIRSVNMRTTKIYNGDHAGVGFDFVHHPFRHARGHGEQLLVGPGQMTVGGRLRPADPPKQPPSAAEATTDSSIPTPPPPLPTPSPPLSADELSSLPAAPISENHYAEATAPASDESDSIQTDAAGDAFLLAYDPGVLLEGVMGELRAGGGMVRQEGATKGTAAGKTTVSVQQLREAMATIESPFEPSIACEPTTNQASPAGSSPRPSSSFRHALLLSRYPLSAYGGVLLPNFWRPTGTSTDRSGSNGHTTEALDPMDHLTDASADASSGGGGAGGAGAGAGAGSSFLSKNRPPAQWPRPQVLDADALLLALSFSSQLSSPSFHLGFDSIGATARTNRLHFHLWYHTPPTFNPNALTDKVKVGLRSCAIHPLRDLA
jgi:hypothetical protein